ncbi:hypothetical protein P5673_028886 [Acropora cervicornis]|uniref:THAP-type domain-containing protein n=1 Tax=Acropora cervicornis TaxID=6130 RepID=A0AAD9PWJ4_ACRCE|nr:hypothetical protein P5673_028886 [Acropora cervicornis]
MNERERRRRWIVACRLESLSVTRHTRICSKHFEGGLGPTKANPIPTIFDFPKHLQPKKVKQRQDPEERRLKGVMNASMRSATQKQSRPRPSQSKASASLNLREPTLYQENQLKHNESRMGEQISDQEMLFAPSELGHNESVVDNEIDDRDLLLVKSQSELSVNPTKFKDDLLYHDEAVQTDLTADQVSKMEQAHFKLHEQRNELKRELFMEDVQRDDNSVKFYTGLPSLSCLLMLFNFLKPIANGMKYWDGKNKTRTEKYQENTDKGKPGRKRQLPLFAEFVMVLVRLRLEIKVEKPSAPSSQKVTWSDYKSHNTFKLLVGITPSGAFSFISDLYSGAISDRAITIKSGLLEQLEPMDDVMADRAFNLRDLITKKKATLNIPPFAKGKQLSTKACTRTRRIASLRIHVERAIQRMKKFRLLQGVIPISIAAVANQVVFVCAALCNFLKPLVKK